MFKYIKMRVGSVLTSHFSLFTYICSMSLKDNIGRRILGKLISRKENPRIIPKFDEARDFLLAWDDAQSDTEVKWIQGFIKFLENHGKSIYTVVYHHQPKTMPAHSEPEEIHLSRKDFSRWGLPKTLQVKKLIAHDYDYFINLNIDGRLPLRSLAGLTKSACRIGVNKV